MKVTIIEGKEVTIGDLIAFKLGTEQHGKLIKIDKENDEVSLTLEDEGGFDHSVMKGDKTWVVPANRAWIHKIMQPKNKKVGKNVIINGQEVQIGDEVQFKYDVEQSGKIKSFKSVDDDVELTLVAEHCFSGGYIGGDKETTIMASRCWLMN